MHSTKADADAAGHSHYFTGEPCRHGHIAPKRVKGWPCVECARLAYEKKAPRHRRPREIISEQERLLRRKAYLVNYWKKNKEWLSEKHREYYQKNREREALKDKARYEKNKESIRKKKKEYYEKNRESLIKRQREYRKNNKEKIREQKRAYYWKKKGQPGRTKK